MSEAHDAGRYRFCSGIRVRQFGTDLVVLNLEADVAYNFNETAGSVLQAIEQGRTVTQMANEVALRYDVQVEEALRDVRDLLESLIRERIVAPI